MAQYDKISKNRMLEGIFLIFCNKLIYKGIDTKHHFYFTVFDTPL